MADRDTVANTRKNKMCNCVNELEDRITEAFKGKYPEMTDHKVRIQGFSSFINRETLTVTYRQFASVVATANYRTKNDTLRTKKENLSLVFKYCPFCGEKQDEEKP